MREGGGRLDGGQVNRGSDLRQKVWEAKNNYFIPTANPFRRTHSPLPPLPPSFPAGPGQGHSGPGAGPQRGAGQAGRGRQRGPQHTGAGMTGGRGGEGRETVCMRGPGGGGQSCAPFILSSILPPVCPTRPLLFPPSPPHPPPQALGDRGAEARRAEEGAAAADRRLAEVRGENMEGRGCSPFVPL